MFGLFFFQAEDGIRDLVRSRGLGDVYKRQEHGLQHVENVSGPEDRQARIEKILFTNAIGRTIPVSYTHLTLPTSDLV